MEEDHVQHLPRPALQQLLHLAHGGMQAYVKVVSADGAGLI